MTAPTDAHRDAARKIVVKHVIKAVYNSPAFSTRYELDHGPDALVDSVASELARVEREVEARYQPLLAWCEVEQSILGGMPMMATRARQLRHLLDGLRSRAGGA